MRIGVLTYTSPHRKTFDTLCRLFIKGFFDVTVFAKEMTYVKKYRPLFQHRPDMNYLVPQTSMCCDAFGYSYQEFENFSEIEGYDAYLVCGVGLIPEDFVARHRIINAHPGLIPEVRGLDSLKWALFEGKPVGVSTHFLGNEIDAGEVIERREIELIEGESLFELGMRVYYNEIDMLVQALEKINDKHECLAAGESVVHKRMPTEIEKVMMDAYRKSNLVY